MARYHGRTGVVYMSPDGTGAAVAVAHLTEWSLNMAADTVEVTSFDDSNKSYVMGFKDASGALSGVWDDTSDAIYDGAGSSDGVKFYLYPASAAPTKYFYGPAWVDFSISTSSSAAVTVSGNFVANGAWGQK